MNNAPHFFASRARLSSLVLALAFAIFAAPAPVRAEVFSFPAQDSDTNGDIMLVESAGNTVTVTGGVLRNAYGGFEGGWGDGAIPVTGNTITVTDGTAEGIWGGYSFARGTVSGNNVIISGGESGGVIGGASAEGKALNNTVNFSGKARTTILTGGRGKTLAKGNKVTVSGAASALDRIIGGEGGDFGSSGKASANVVTLSGSGKRTSVYGGYATRIASKNRVTISGGKYFTMGQSGSGKAMIVGGHADTGNSTGNTVVIKGKANIRGTIYGGFSYKGKATGNTVTLSGTPKLALASIYGGHANKHVYPDEVYKYSFKNNRLHANAFRGKVKELKNFHKLDFTLPKNVRNGDTIVTVTSGQVNLNKTIVTLRGIKPGGKGLKTGDSVTLIKGDTYGSIAKTKLSKVKQGARVYSFALKSSSGGLSVRVTKVGTNARATALAKSRRAGLALVNQGADFLAEQTMAEARSLAAQSAGLFAFGASADSRGGMSAAGYLSGGMFSSSTAGLGYSQRNEAGSLFLGAFFEHGEGGFNSLSERGRYDGGAGTSGAGVLARFDHAAGLYAEGSFRSGRAKASLASADLGGDGADSGFDSSYTYTGMHAGIGLAASLGDALNLDVSTKYFATRLGGDTAGLSGETVRFEAAESRWLKAGAVLSWQAAESVKPYVGAAWEHEFAGLVRSSVSGCQIDPVNLRGGTGVLRAGLDITPSRDLPLALNLDVRSLSGARQGYTGMLGLKFEF